MNAITDDPLERLSAELEQQTLLEAQRIQSVETNIKYLSNQVESLSKKTKILTNTTYTVAILFVATTAFILLKNK